MDTALKQRLVGASVLIALAVVVLPMLLGGRPNGQEQQSQKIELPPHPPELNFETRRYPVGEQAPQGAREEAPRIKPLPTPDDTTTVDATEPVPEPLEVSPGMQTGTVGESESARNVAPQRVPEQATAAPPESRPSSGQAGRYVVQVASFGSMDNANRLSETLRGYGYDVMSDTVKSDVGTLHRVRVGPFGSETEAGAVLSRLQAQIGDVKPRIMDLQPEQVAQLTQPSDPLVRWVVQVGSFSNPANADKLVARLRLESLTAYKEEVTRSGSTVYRVRIGPYLEREEAISADRRVRERLSIEGVVMSAD